MLCWKGILSLPFGPFGLPTKRKHSSMPRARSLKTWQYRLLNFASLSYSNLKRMLVPRKTRERPNKFSCSQSIEYYHTFCFESSTPRLQKGFLVQYGISGLVWHLLGWVVGPGAIDGRGLFLFFGCKCIVFYSLFLYALTLTGTGKHQVFYMFAHILLKWCCWC